MRVRIKSLPKKELGGRHYTDRIPSITKKQLSFFGGNTTEPSNKELNGDKVTTSEKPVDPSIANIEAEKGEKHLTKKGIYTIKGKSHKQGGTPLIADSGDFIYSQSKKMEMDKALPEVFDLKVGSDKKITPAKLVDKNISKNYNKNLAILSSDKEDMIAKNTASLMLEKDNETLQKIASIQEGLKADKMKVPSDTIEGKTNKKQIDKQKQFKLGGVYETEGDVNIDYLNKNGSVKKDYSTKIFKSYHDTTSNTDYNAPSGLTPEQFYNTPGLVAYMNTLNDKKGIDNDMNKADDSVWGPRHKEVYEKYYLPYIQKKSESMETVNPKQIFLPIETPGLKKSSNIQNIVKTEQPLNNPEQVDNYQHLQRDHEVDRANNAMYANEMMGHKVFYHDPSFHEYAPLRSQTTDVNPIIQNVQQNNALKYRMLNNFATPQQAQMALEDSQDQDKINQAIHQAKSEDAQRATQINNVNSEMSQNVSNFNNDQKYTMLNQNKNALTNFINEGTNIQNRNIYRTSIANQDYKQADWKNKTIEEQMAVVDEKTGKIEYPHNPDGSFNSRYPGGMNAYLTKIMQSGQTNQFDMTDLEEQLKTLEPKDQVKLLQSYIMANKRK